MLRLEERRQQRVGLPQRVQRHFRAASIAVAFATVFCVKTDMIVTLAASALPEMDYHVLPGT